MSARPLAWKTSTSLAPATRVSAGLLQRQCACGQHMVAGGTCEACGDQAQPMRRRSGNQTEMSVAPPIVHDALRSPGRPLDGETRGFMEPRFAHDFSGVRVHTDARAAASARAVNASAYTVGRDIVFAENRYAPATTAGTRLLAHELAHTIQQGGAGAASSPTTLNIDPAGDAHENEADQSAAAILAGRSAKVDAGSPFGLQRQQHEGGKPTEKSSGVGMQFGQGSGRTLEELIIEKSSPGAASVLGFVTLDGFETGSAELSAAHQAELDKAARNIIRLLQKYALSSIQIIGFTDTVGSEARNLKLGIARAERVKQALVERRVPAVNITTESRGEGPPQATKTKNEVGNASNRRVEVRFYPKALPTSFVTPTQTTETPPKSPIMTQRPIEKVNRRAFDFQKYLSLKDKIRSALDKKIPRAPGWVKDKIADLLVHGFAKLARVTAEAVTKDPAILDFIENLAEDLPDAQLLK